MLDASNADALGSVNAPAATPVARANGHGEGAALEPLRILMATPRYPPFAGGVEQHVREVGRRLAAAGCTVTVLTTDPTRRLPRHEMDAGVSIVRVPAWPRRRDFYFAPRIYRSIVAGRAEWDIVHVQSYHTFVAPLAMLAARRAGLPYLLTFHGGGHSSTTRQLLRRVQWPLLAPLVRKAARLVAIARFEIGLYGASFRVPADRFELISNGVEIPSVQPLGPPTDGLIASVGRLERYKGHHRVLAALPAILEQRPDARLWIAGSGPYEGELRKQAAALGVADRVDIRSIAPTEREEMAREIRRASLVVLLSEYETQPLAVLEAVALGRPALVADTSGLSELAERGLATAIPLSSGPDEVAAAVLGTLGSAPAPLHEPLPTWDDCASALLELYRKVVAEHHDANSGTPC
jgi:glycosyltransferase involved in cell wall biosynthesis